MKENVVPEFIAGLPRKNKPGYPIAKAFWRYCLIFLIAFFAGMLFCTSGIASSAPEGELSQKIIGHFTDVFKGCSSCKHYFTVIISASTDDIRCLILLFAAGFTYFCAIASSALILCRGFTVGFSLQYLITVSSSGLIELPKAGAATLIFIITELTVALFLHWLAAKSLVFGYEFRKLRGRRSRILGSPIIYRYLFLYLTAFGCVLIINTLSCIALFIIYR